jgi:hypothetical protein
MKKAFFLFWILLLNGHAQLGNIPQVRPVECQIKRGVKSQTKVFTLHENYSLIVRFENLQLSLLADHGGFPGSRGNGYRYVIFYTDPKVGGLVQGATSGTFTRPLSLEDISFQDVKLNLRVRCRGR